MTGYTFTSTTATTYGGTSSVSCAKGYDGTASPATVSCQADGSWTTVSGCGIEGIYKCLLRIFGRLNQPREDFIDQSFAITVPLQQILYVFHVNPDPAEPGY